MMKIRYFNKGTGRMKEKDIPADVLSVVIPEQPDEGLPALEVNVNTDAVLINALEVAPFQGERRKLGGLTFVELYAEAEERRNKTA